MFGRQSTIALRACLVLCGVLTACVLQVSAVGAAAWTLGALLLGRWVTDRWRHACGCVAALAFGVALAAVRIDAELRQRWPVSAADGRVLVEASVDSLPAERGGEWLADARVRVLRPDCVRQCERRLRIAGPLGATVPRAGERWQWVLRVSPPRARVNPGGVDLERQWLLERVHGTARVVESRLNRRTAPATAGLLRLRERLRDGLAAALPDREARGLVTALAIGDTSGMSREQWRVFAATGTTHLVAISGLHVTLFAWCAAAGARRIWVGLAPLRRVRRESFALVVGVLAAFLYSLLAGFSIPTQRTVIMLACAALARLAGREVAAADVLGVAVLGVLAVDPLAPLDVGFWLSFGAMAALMLAGEGASGDWRTSLRGMVREQLWLGAALAPLTLALFGSVSLAGLLTNFVAIPLFSFVLVPLSLAGTAAVAVPHGATLAALLLPLAGRLHDLCWPALQWLAGVDAASWSPPVSPGAVLIAAPAIALLWWPAPRRLRLTALIALAPLLATAAPGPQPGGLRLTMLDVGDGGAVLVRTRTHALLHGTGASFGSDAAAVEQHVLPALRAAGVPRLDAVVLTHASGAEVEGLARLQAGRAVRVAWVGGEWPGAPAGVHGCPRLASWAWDGVQFELRGAPLPAGSASWVTGACVLRLRAAGRAVLVTGTAGRGDLQALLDSRAAIRADVIVGAARPVGRSLERRWISAVRPGWVVALRARLDHAAHARAAAAHGLAGGRLYSPARHGPLHLDLAVDGSLRLVPALDRWFEPAWRVAREPLANAVLAAPVRYDPRLVSSGDHGQCGRSCGPAVR